MPDDYPFLVDRQTSRGTRLPSSIPVAIRPRFLPSSHRHNGQLVRRACIGVYRPIATAAGVLLPFVIYAALSSAPQQRSYSFDRSNPSIVYIYIYIPFLFPRGIFHLCSNHWLSRYRDSVSLYHCLELGELVLRVTESFFYLPSFHDQP